MSKSYDCKCGAKGSIPEKSLFFQHPLVEGRSGMVMGTCDVCGTTIKIRDPKPEDKTLICGC